VITLLALVSTAAYGLSVASNAKMIADGDYFYYSSYGDYDMIQKSLWHVSLAYQVLYFVVSILAIILGFFFLIKERSKVKCSTFLQESKC
jgi:hypothetical protein